MPEGIYTHEEEAPVETEAPETVETEESEELVHATAEAPVETEEPEEAATVEVNEETEETNSTGIANPIVESGRAGTLHWDLVEINAENNEYEVHVWDKERTNKLVPCTASGEHVARAFIAGFELGRKQTFTHMNELEGYSEYGPGDKS